MRFYVGKPRSSTVLARKARISIFSFLSTLIVVVLPQNAMAEKPYNVLDQAGPFSEKMDFSHLINKALAEGKTVWLPKISQSYVVSESLLLTEGSGLLCDDGVKLVSSTAAVFFKTKGANTAIKNCFFERVDGAKGSIGLVDKPNFTWEGGGSNKGAGLFLNGPEAKFAKVLNTRQLNSTGSAIALQNRANNNSIIGNEVQDARGFGVWLTLGAHDNLIEKNWTDRNRIELVGVTSTAFNNKVINNSAKYTGDNCFSITGSGNVVLGNYGENCGFAGLYVYGSKNRVVGNVINGAAGVQDSKHPFYQPDNKLKYGAITVSGSWFGAAQDNLVEGNTVMDDRPRKTTAYGIKVGAGYQYFQPHKKVAKGELVYNAMNIYQAQEAGITGSRSPTCTSGMCSDGAVEWTWVNATVYDSKEPQGNVIVNNQVQDLPEPYVDQTTEKRNRIQKDVVQAKATNAQRSLSGDTPADVPSGPLEITCTAYQKGATYNLGSVVVFNHKVYKSVNKGGVAVTQPTHTQGVQKSPADGIAWFAISPQLLNTLGAGAGCGG